MRRVVAVTPTGYMGGSERALVRLARWAREGGWQMTVAGPTGPLSEAISVEAGAEWVEIPQLKLPAGPRVSGLPVLGIRAVRASRVIRRAGADADLVIANGLLALPAIRLARPRCPVVHLVRDILDRRDWQVALKLFGATACVAVAPSDAAARPLRGRGLATRVVRHGTPWPVAPARPPSPPPVVGIAASITPLRGHEILLDAVARLDRSDVIVEFAGGVYYKDRDYERHLRERVERGDLIGRVRFLGHIDNVLDRMRSWHIFVAPSVYPETAGLAILEAMSIGVPVIATNHGGPPEVVGEAGLLVPPGDADRLATALARLLEDQRLRDRCARAGPTLVEANYTLDRERRELLSVLDDALRHPGGTATP